MLAHTWSERLAEQVAPDEVPLAASVVDMFLAGGEEQRELLAPSGSSPGAFGSGGMLAVMPSVFFALASVGGPILALVGNISDGVKLLEVVKGALTVLELKLKRDSLTKPAPTAELVPQGTDFVPLRTVLTALSAELRTTGLPADQCDLISFRVTRTLLEDPKPGAQFVRQLMEAKAK